MDCFASLAMTVLQSFAPGCLKFESDMGGTKAGRSSPLPLRERSDRIVRCDPGVGLRSTDRPEPLNPTLESELRSSRSRKGRGSSPPMPRHAYFWRVVARKSSNSVSHNKRRGVWIPARASLGRDDEDGGLRYDFHRDKFCSRKFSAVSANTCMFASRSALPVSSVIAIGSDPPATPMQLWPAASP
jgi:hypothetical protein